MRRTVLLIAPLLLSVASVHGQVALYVTSSSDHLTNVETGSRVVGSSNQEQYAGYWASGIGGGLTLNFRPLGPVKLGFDFRGSTRPGTTGADTAMGGIKLGVNPPVIRIKPYIEGSAGYVATRTVNVSAGANGGTFNNRCVGWEILGGVDYPLVHFVDFRVIEIGGGKAYPILGTTSSNLSLLTINTGLVFHF